MSSANRINLARIFETSYGVPPSGPPKLADCRLTSEDFAPRIGYVKSKELRSDEQTGDVVPNDFAATGSIDGEWSYGTYDAVEFLAVMRASGYSSVVTNTTTISFAAADNSINRASGDFTGDGYAVGQWLRLRKAAGANPATIYAKIVSIVALKIVLSHVVLVNESAISTEIEMGAQIVNGTTTRSIYYEREYRDRSNDFARYYGMKADTWELNTNAKQILTTKFGFIGQKEQSATATLGDGSNTGATTSPVMNAIFDAKAVLESGLSFAITKCAMNLKRNHREQDQVATLGPVDVIAGSIDLTGSFDVYYAGPTKIDKLLSNTKTSFAQVLEDSAGNAHIFEIPRLKFSNGKRSANGGINTDIVQPIAWEAYRHETEGITMRFAKWDN